jgi:hypothetical protein
MVSYGLGGLVRRVAALAAANNSIVECHELLQLGATYDWIARQVTAGWLTPLHRGIYLVGSAVPTLEARWTAAVRSGGPNAILLGLSGAVQWEMLPRHRVPDVDDVFVDRSVAARAGIRYRRLGWLTRREHRRRRGIPIGSPAAIVVSLAMELSTHELVHLMDRGEFHDRAIASDLERILRSGPFHGRARIERAFRHFRDGESGFGSGFEFNIDRALAELGAPPGLVNPLLRLRDGGTLRPDRYWPDARLIVEADGGFHSTERRQGLDMGRDARAQLSELDTIRIPSWIPPSQRGDMLRAVAERARLIQDGPRIDIVARAARAMNL